jgi:hypothetical protein
MTTETLSNQCITSICVHVCTIKIIGDYGWPELMEELDFCGKFVITAYNEI